MDHERLRHELLSRYEELQSNIRAYQSRIPNASKEKGYLFQIQMSMQQAIGAAQEIKRLYQAWFRESIVDRKKNADEHA